MDQKLDQFVQKLKSTGGENLKAVVLYGSAVTEEFHSKHSDLNTLCILERTDVARITSLQPAVEWWNRQGHRPPLIFTMEELRRSADIYAIELIDMKAHHKMLWGEDIFEGLSVPLRYHSMQVERELRTNWLRLRQALLAAPKKNKVYLDLMVSSFSSFAALFRHALISLGEAPAGTKREAIDRVAQFAHSDPDGFHTILDYREGKRKERGIDIQETLNRYFVFVDAVTNEFDRRLDASS